MQRIIDVIKGPVISEKSTLLNEVSGRYVFEVDTKASKPEIKEAIETLFDVQVKEIRTLILHGKYKRMRNNIVKMPAKKKAIVSLAKGQRIDLFQTQTGGQAAAPNA